MKLHRTCSLFAVIIFICTNTSRAQLPRDSELFITLQKHDSLFFERGFNRCDTSFLKQATHGDLVFFHDKAGISNQTQFLESVSKNLCGDMNKKPIRKVRKETLEVYPLYNDNKLYGVVQMGVHDFFIRTPNNPDVQSGTAKFTHVYLLQNEQWVLREVLSFDHK